MGGVEEAVADVDVVVEVVEVVVVAVVLVDVLDGGDGLAAVERRVAVGIHGGARASSRVRVFRIRVGGGAGERSWCCSHRLAENISALSRARQVLPSDVGRPMENERIRLDLRKDFPAQAHRHGPQISVRGGWRRRCAHARGFIGKFGGNGL